MTHPALSSIVGRLPASTPFVGPEALERLYGIRLAVRLGANESLFGPSPRALRAMREAAGEIHLYGDPESFDLRDALAASAGVTIDHLVLGSGIDELLGLFAQAYADPGDVAVMSAGGYPTMAYQLAAHGVRMATAPYRDFRNDVDGLLAAARSSRAKLLYLSNPDNPTGSWLTGGEITRLIEGLPAGCLLLLDEAYIEFAASGDVPPIDPDDPRIVRFRTFSKVYGLAGLRVGYAFGAPGLVRPIDRIRNQFGVGRLAQAGALAALGDQAFVAGVVAEVAAGREAYRDLATSAGYRALPSATNFVAIDLGGRAIAAAVLAELQNIHGVFVRMPGTSPLDHCVRVTVGPDESRAAFVGAFKSVILSEKIQAKYLTLERPVSQF